jgi:hypothetical protein
MTIRKLRGARFGPVAWSMVILLALIAKILLIRSNAENIIISFPRSSDLCFVPIESLASGKSRQLEYKAMLIP